MTPSSARATSFVTYGLLAGAILTIIAWVIVVLLYREHVGTSFVSESGRWGEFGDYLAGVLNPILGTFTLVAVMITVKLQGNVLRETRRQVHLMEQQIADVNLQSKIASLTAQQQSFEATFFELFDRLDKAAAVVLRKPEASTFASRSHLEEILSRLESLSGLVEYVDESERATAMQKVYEEWRRQFTADTLKFLTMFAATLVFLDQNRRQLAEQIQNASTVEMIKQMQSQLMMPGQILRDGNWYTDLVLNTRTEAEARVFCMYAAFGELAWVADVAVKTRIDQEIGRFWWATEYVRAAFNAKRERLAKSVPNPTAST